MSVSIAERLPRIIFLHLPKTAGQSVHAALVRRYGPSAVAPLRNNRDFERHEAQKLLDYRVFSGHLDWDRLNFVPQPVVVTVLREPLERIASFYLFLRRQAEHLSSAELARPDRRGMYLAKHLSPDDYFCDPDLPEREFLDGHFDNFFTHYFAGRSFNSRTRLRKRLRNTSNRDEELLELAHRNLSELDVVGRIEALPSFERRLGEVGVPLRVARVRKNVNGEGFGKRRFPQLEALGLSRSTRERLRSFTRLDDRLLTQIPADEPSSPTR